MSEKWRENVQQQVGQSSAKLRQRGSWRCSRQTELLTTSYTKHLSPPWIDSTRLPMTGVQCRHPSLRPYWLKPQVPWIMTLLFHLVLLPTKWCKLWAWLRKECTWCVYFWSKYPRPNSQGPRGGFSMVWSYRYTNEPLWKTDFHTGTCFSYTFADYHGSTPRICSVTHSWLECAAKSKGRGQRQVNSAGSSFFCYSKKVKTRISVLDKLSFGVSIQTLSSISFPEPSWDHY